MSDKDLLKRVQFARMLDFYGALLSDYRLQIAREYCDDDLTLAEMAAEMQEDGRTITRQGVHSALRAAQKQLIEFEDKLGLVAKFDEMQREINAIREILVEARSKIKFENDSAIAIKAFDEIAIALDKLEEA